MDSSINRFHKRRLNQLRENEQIRGSKDLAKLQTKNDSADEIVSTFNRVGSRGKWTLKSIKEEEKIKHELFPPKSKQPSSTTVDDIKSNPRFAGGLI